MTIPSSALPEWWQRGPAPGIAALLQPVAHVLLQLRDDVPAAVAALTEAQWNARPAGVASIAFHVRHIGGVFDRMFTYARGDTLSDAQFAALALENAPVAAHDIPVLLAWFSAQIDERLHELRRVDESRLTDARTLGRAKLPTTVIGCLVHAAEHGTRHYGQLSVTARVVTVTAAPHESPTPPVAP
ncbi:DinB family protein [Gemmatimonas groenlandica]|uniref:DinB family protein n=1 Tax=Gemmatimonas groenlandica TaxID=2732249 RepID=A0A6M4IVF4_9BACT|nr:DinB family protein [Gemmatimonas groenlandica]QJR36802.1 DinB family protein [Gemmatimonas groenlandica]